MSIASRSTNVRARPTGLDQPNRDGAYDRSSNVARLGVDGGEQESLLAEWRELGNNFGERKVESAWPGKATGRDTVNAMISMGTDSLVGTTVLAKYWPEGEPYEAAMFLACAGVLMEKSTFSPSAIVGCVRMASRNTV